MAFFGGRRRGDHGLSNRRNIVANLKCHSDLTPVSTSHYHPSLARGGNESSCLLLHHPLLTVFNFKVCSIAFCRQPQQVLLLQILYHWHHFKHFCQHPFSFIGVETEEARRNYARHLKIVRPPMVLIEIFAKHSLAGFLSTFLILFAALS